MKTEDTGKAQEEVAKEEKAQGSPGCVGMFREMMAGGMPPCCKAQMPACPVGRKDMMAQWMSRLQASEGKAQR